MTEKCVICELHLTSDVILVKKRGLARLITASEARKDNKHLFFVGKNELQLHRKCRLIYIEEKCIQAHKKRINTDNEKKERMDAGENTAKFKEFDKIFFNIIEDASRDGLDVSEDSEHETISETDWDNTLPAEAPKLARSKASILQRINSMDDVSELEQLKKKKAKIEIELMEEKVEIAKRQKYKLDLELVKMERDLGIAQLSSFTAPYSHH